MNMGKIIFGFIRRVEFKGRHVIIRAGSSINLEAKFGFFIWNELIPGIALLALLLTFNLLFFSLLVFSIIFKFRTWPKIESQEKPAGEKLAATPAGSSKTVNIGGLEIGEDTLRMMATILGLTPPPEVSATATATPPKKARKKDEIHG